MSDFKNDLKKIATDLLNLEINTIIKPNIEGIKMPDPRHALLDIAKDYNMWLSLRGIKRGNQNEEMRGGKDTFDQLREGANTKIAELNKRSPLTPEEQADLVMLSRIKDKCDQLKGMFDAMKKRGGADCDNAYTRSQLISSDQIPSFPLIPSELVLIRKIWDLGTAEIALQTVIQMDGDVVTYVTPKYVSSNSAMVNNELVHKLHSQGISTSVSFWKELVDVLRKFFETIVKLFSGAF